MKTPIEEARQAEGFKAKANSGIGLVVRGILLVIAVIWFVVGLIIYLGIMTSTND